MIKIETGSTIYRHGDKCRECGMAAWPRTSRRILVQFIQANVNKANRKHTTSQQKAQQKTTYTMLIMFKVEIDVSMENFRQVSS